MKFFMQIREFSGEMAGDEQGWGEDPDPWIFDPLKNIRVKILIRLSLYKCYDFFFIF